MEEQNHKQDALSCLGAAEGIAGADGNSLNSPPAQADYFLQKGMIHAILHLADVLEWEDGITFDEVINDRPTIFPTDEKVVSPNEVTTYDVSSEPEVMNERPSPTMTILVGPEPSTTSEDDSGANTVEEPRTPRTPRRRSGSKKKGT